MVVMFLVTIKIKYDGTKIDLLTPTAKEKERKHQRTKWSVVTTISVVSCQRITWDKYKEDANDLWKTQAGISAEVETDFSFHTAF